MKDDPLVIFGNRKNSDYWICGVEDFEILSKYEQIVENLHVEFKAKLFENKGTHNIKRVIDELLDDI